MLQAIMKKGKVIAEKVPAPVVSRGSVLIKVVCSAISVGTEMVSFDTSKKSMIKRALEQPHNVRKVINMAKSDAVAKVYKKAKNKIDEGRATGYSLSGVVIGLGKGVTRFKVGDRVAAGGSGVAYHAEFVDVPENLVVHMPEDLDFARASTVAIGAIAMQGVRRANLNLGEFAAVFGVGVIGLLSVQMLSISGIRVAAIDINDDRLQIAKEAGAELVVNPDNDRPIQEIINWSNGFGVDATLFTAATNKSEPLSQAFRMCKKKGRVVLVGVSGMNIKRTDLYQKEIDLLMSTSYGPGRYDKNYEEKGLEYPYAYVRWTENRNMSEYLRLINEGLIKVDQLSLEKYPIEKVNDAFEALRDSDKKAFSVILDYGEPEYQNIHLYKTHDRRVFLNNIPINKNIINIALIGTGNFAVNMHLPNIAKLSDKYKLFAVMNKTGHKGKNVARQHNAHYVTTNYDDILDDDNVDLVMITTRHDTHAEFALKALNAGKHVFVEKPLAVEEKELDELNAFLNSTIDPPVIMVGFNRRFSKYAQIIKKHTDKRINPLFIHYRMNAGYMPPNHWVHEDGGRMIGECCHIIDLISFLVGTQLKSISHEEFTPRTDHYISGDNKSFILKFLDGSIASINYFAVGNKSCPKEYMEVHFDQKTIILNDYKSLKGYGLKIEEISTKTSQKGHLEELEKLYQSLRVEKSGWPIELWEMIQTTSASFLLK